MKLRMKSSLLVIAALLVSSLAAIPAKASTAPVCGPVVDGIETCGGVLSNGAKYAIKFPASNFKGTFYFWNHGFRPSFPYPGYTPPTGVEEITPGNSVTKKDVTKEMLFAGYGVASYDRSSAGLHGWNTDDSVKMLKELIEITLVKYPNTAYKVVYGSSGAAPVVHKFAETYPNLVDATGVLAGLTETYVNIRTACDMFYLFSVFADPTIKGCAAFGVPGVNGHMLALQELGKVAALLKGWAVDYGAKELAFPLNPATKESQFKGSSIPQRSALLLIGLLSGIPTKSAHMDGISTSALVAEGSINATLAILENFGDALGTGTFAGQAMAEIVGAGFYDNTKTDYAALLDDGDSGRFNLGLSGDEAIAAMLGVLASPVLAPRVVGKADVIAKAQVFDQIKYTSTKPTVMLSNEADRLVFPGNQQLYVDKALAKHEERLAAWQDKYDAATSSSARAELRRQKPRFNVLSMYAMTPETYTVYNDAGIPDLAGAGSPSGTGHQTFSKSQTMTWVRLLNYAARKGQVPSWASVVRTMNANGDTYLSRDEFYAPRTLKYANS